MAKGGKGGGGGGDGGAAQARADEEARQARIRAGTQQVDDIFGSNFTPESYTARRTAYTDYATPQLEDQYANAQKELTFALTRGGNLDSSVRGQKVAELEQLYGKNKQQVADQALSYENTARSSAEDARADLIRTLNATGDAEGAASSATNRAQILSAPDQYSPLGNLFTDFTSALGTQAALERANTLSGGAIKPKYNTGLFGTPSGAVRVTP